METPKIIIVKLICFDLKAGGNYAYLEPNPTKIWQLLGLPPDCEVELEIRLLADRKNDGSG